MQTVQSQPKFTCSYKKSAYLYKNTHPYIIYGWSTDATATRCHERRTSHLIFKSKVTKPCEEHKAIFFRSGNGVHKKTTSLFVKMSALPE